MKPTTTIRDRDEPLAKDALWDQLTPPSATAIWTDQGWVEPRVVEADLIPAKASSRTIG